MVGLLMCNLYFYPRSPCGERLQWEGMRSLSEVISIHALLAESDKDTLTDDVSTGGFLSTLSLRRATLADCTKIYAFGDFYPRSPCGERPVPQQENGQAATISIHALLAESDLWSSKTGRHFQYFYPRSPCGERPEYLQYLSVSAGISIHALLAESDFGRAFWPGLSY